MRQAAQRHMDLQGCMPADIGTMGYNLTVGSQAAINKAFEAWQTKRGIKSYTTWRSRPKGSAPQVMPDPPKPKPVEAPKPPKPVKAPKAIAVPREPRVKTPDSEMRERRLAQKRAYRLANKEAVKEKNRAYQKRRRAAMTPEERKAESAEVNSYRKLASAKKGAK